MALFAYYALQKRHPNCIKSTRHRIRAENVPLNANNPLVSGHFECLDDAVISDR